MTDTTLLGTAESILKSAQELISKMRAPATTPERPRVALYLTITEQFEAAIRLGRVGMGTHGAVHVRSMLEALLSMNLLAQRPGFTDQMRFDKLKGEKKLYESLLTNPNIPAADRASVQTRLDVCKAEYDALFAQGLRPRRITEDFSPAGLADFIGPYTVLCGLSHNDLFALAARHQGDQVMTYKAVVDDDLMQSIYSVAMTVMVSATEPLATITRFTVDGHYDRCFQDMNNAWGAFLQSVGA